MIVLLGLLSYIFCWRGMNGLYLLEDHFRPSRWIVVARRDGSYWVILLGWLTQWTMNCYGVGVVFLSGMYLRVRGYGFTHALFYICLIGGVVLVQHPLFRHIVLLVQPC